MATVTPDQKSEPVQLTEHLWGPAAITVDDLGDSDDYSVRMIFRAARFRGYDLAELTYRSSGDDGLNGTVTRSFPVAKWQEMAGKLGMAGEVKWRREDDGRLLNWIDTDHLVQGKLDGAGGRLHPTDDVLQLVGVCCEYFQVMHFRPTKNVEAVFGVPNRTASYWIRLAKDRGFLQDDPTKIKPGTPPWGPPVSMPTDQLDEYLSRPRTKEI